MTKAILKMAMLNYYNKTSASHKYILGFDYNNNIYMITVSTKIIQSIIRLESTGRDGYALRYKPNNKIKTYLLTLGAIVLCSTEYFNHIVNTTKYNKGEVFERLITEYYNQEWCKDNIDYRVQGDININDTEVQIKYERATFITEGQVKRQKRS